MAAASPNASAGISPEMVAELTRLYEAGHYVQAAALANPAPSPWEWRGTAACVIGGRLANNLFAPRLARALHARAWRHDRHNAETAYYFAYSILSHRGPLATLKFLRGLPAFDNLSPVQHGDLLLIRARAVGMFRDFSTATRLIAEAEPHCCDRPWFWVEKSALHEQQDQYEEALASTRQALAMQPFFRPAVQSSGQLLQLLGRDEEAVQLLQDSLKHLEAPGITAQLSVLQAELGRYQDALESWQRVRPLAPWMESGMEDWWQTRLSDAFYFAGDFESAAGIAEKCKNPFHQKMAERLRSPGPGARRVLLPVGFVRQHYFTCAPATLSALSGYWQMPVDHLALAAAICYDGTPDHIERHWAEENGWHAREFRVTWEVLVALIDRGVPFTLATLETQSAHLQAVIGYDRLRNTILIRDPYQRTHGEWLATEFLERYAASGPRGMVLLPQTEVHRLEGIELPEAVLYDSFYRLRRALHGYNRQLAQSHYEAMEGLDAAHRLTVHARWALASYDGSLSRQLTAIEDLLLLFPKNGQYLWAKLLALRELARRADYQEFLRELALEKQIDVVFWREWAEELRHDARRWPEAHRMLLRIMRFRPIDAENLQALANLHWDRREFAEATELYRYAATLRDKVDAYARAYFLAARHLAKTDLALQWLDRRVEAFGQQSSQPVKTLFWALSILDRQPEAFEKLKAALKSRPEDGDLLLFAADAYARHQPLERGSLQAELALNPDSTDRRTDQGHELLRAAENRIPRTQWLRTAANLAEYRCDLTNALISWHQILETEPLDLPAQRAYTRLVAQTQGRAVALEHLRTTCERFDHHIGLHVLWVEWARAENNVEAEPVLRQLLALHPDNAWAHRELALVLSELHRVAEAVTELDIAALLEPQSPSTDGIRAHVALQDGRHAEAQELARSALRLSIDYELSSRDLLAASIRFEEKRAAVAFIREELIRQVVFGDGLLAYRSVAFEIIEPPDLLASLREALKARPDLWHAWSSVVLQLVDMHQLDEALSLAQQATERFPLLPRLWIDLGQVYRARRERENEIAPIQRALQLSPGWSRPWQLLANTHERMGDYPEAARILEQGIAANPLDPILHGSLANVLHHLNRKDEAIQRLEHALKLEPGYDYAWNALRAWSPTKGTENRAAVLARQLTALRPGEARSWMILARVLIGAPLEERLGALERALTLDPRLVDAHDLRAMLLCEKRRYDEAMAACAPPIFGEAIPTFLRGRSAWIEAERGRTRAAIERMRQVVEAAPDYYWGWNMLAEWHLADHNFPAAQEAAQKMARLAPRNAVPLGYLADIQARSKQLAAAFATLERAYAIDPTYAFAGFTLFDHHLQENRLAEAEKLLATIETHLPGPNATTARIRLLARRGESKDALATCRRLLADPAADAQTLRTAVDALLKARWSSAVETMLDEALKIPATNPEVGALWVQRSCARGAWNCRRRVCALSNSTAAGKRIRIAYIEELARGKSSHLLGKFVKHERAWLRNDATAWGTTGYAYVQMSDWRKAIRWMSDWSERPDLEPWMLLNLATAYRQKGDDKTALAINQHALKLVPDGTTTRHRLWIVHEIALLGDMPAVASRLEELREHELGNYEKALLALIKALRAIHLAAPAERRKVYAEQRANLHSRLQNGEYADTVLNRSRHRTVIALAQVSNDPWIWLRKFASEINGGWGPRRPVATTKGSGSSPVALRLVCIVVALAASMLHLCSSSDSPSSTPYSTYPFNPPSHSTPQPVRQERTTRDFVPPRVIGPQSRDPQKFELGPNYQRPVQLLPTPPALHIN